MPTELTLTVTKFTEKNSATPPRQAEDNCTILPELQMSGDATGAWKHDPAGQVFLCPAPDLGTIAVKRKAANTGPVELIFTIASGANVPALTPTEIVFEQQDFKDDKRRAKGDADGSLNFPKPGRIAAGGKLSVANHWVHHGKSKDRSKHVAPLWKFWIRVTTADGRVGWIDPIIENSDDMSA